MSLFRDLVSKLSEYKEGFAVYGPLAANFYRESPREISELAFGLALGSAKKSKKVADGLLQELGYSIDYQWLEGLQSKTGKAVSVVMGTPPEDSPELPVHFHIPSLPWVSKGVRRGQTNLQQIEGIDVPVVPVDDLIPAKTHALVLNPKASIDLEDLRSIFVGDTELDIPYIIGEFNQLGLKLPKKLAGDVPEELAPYLQK